ncbi:MAG: M48 family metallopeptidase [Pseudomonadota bacterium]
MDLVYPKEKPLFLIALVISILVWALLILGTLGLALLYGLLFYVLILFAQSAFITQLKGNGVKVTAEQFPDLHQQVIECCEKVGMDEPPEVYLLRTDFFNALATRFLGRHFIVLFTDVVDALEDKPDAVRFYIGHELGHIHRKHLKWGPVIAPALILPILGAALRRAEEYTCDLYGSACCANDGDVAAAMATIAAGDTRWKQMNVNAYLQQIKQTSGFWMSFNEITSDYPWLSKRLGVVLAARQGKNLTRPSRHPLAWFLAIFVPRMGGGGSIGGVVFLAAIVAILAAIAIPAYQDYTARAVVTQAYLTGTTVSNEMMEYGAANQSWPESLMDLGYSTDSLPIGDGAALSIYENGIIGVEITAVGADRYLVLEPQVDDDGAVNWVCYGQDLEEKYLPMACK